MSNFAPMSPPVLRPLLDAHAHLQDERLGSDLAGVMERARTHGVAALVCNGSSEADWPAVASLSRDYAHVLPCFGLHPWYAAERSPGWLESLAGHLEACPSLVGEIGLDRRHAPGDEAAQEDVFRAQLRLARDLDRPVVVHCVRSWDWLQRILQDEPPPDAGLMFHAFGGSADLARWATRYERVFFSLGGGALHARSARRLDALRAIPRERLLIETDAPDLLPPPEARWFAIPRPDGKLANEPANLGAILRGLASLLGMAAPDLAALTWRNGRAFLGRYHPCPEAV